MGHFKARRSVALACALRASRAADVRLAPFIRQPALAYGIWGFFGQCWLGRSVYRQLQRRHIFFVAKKFLHTSWPTKSNKKAQTAFFSGNTSNTTSGIAGVDTPNSPTGICFRPCGVFFRKEHCICLRRFAQ